MIRDFDTSNMAQTGLSNGVEQVSGGSENRVCFRVSRDLWDRKVLQVSEVGINHLQHVVTELTNTLHDMEGGVGAYEMGHAFLSAGDLAINFFKRCERYSQLALDVDRMVCVVINDPDGTPCGVELRPPRQGGSEQLKALLTEDRVEPISHAADQGASERKRKSKHKSKRRRKRSRPVETAVDQGSSSPPPPSSGPPAKRQKTPKNVKWTREQNDIIRAFGLANWRIAYDPKVWPDEADAPKGYYDTDLKGNPIVGARSPAVVYYKAMALAVGRDPKCTQKHASVLGVPIKRPNPYPNHADSPEYVKGPLGWGMQLRGVIVMGGYKPDAMLKESAEKLRNALGADVPPAGPVAAAAAADGDFPPQAPLQAPPPQAPVDPQIDPYYGAPNSATLRRFATDAEMQID